MRLEGLVFSEPWHERIGRCPRGYDIDGHIAGSIAGRRDLLDDLHIDAHDTTGGIRLRNADVGRGVAIARRKSTNLSYREIQGLLNQRIQRTPLGDRLAHKDFSTRPADDPLAEFFFLALAHFFFLFFSLLI